MKTCKRCGNIIDNDDIRFCNICGADLQGNISGGIWLGEEKSKDNDKDKKKADNNKNKEKSIPIEPKPKVGKLSLALMALAAVALVVILVIVIKPSDDNEKKNILANGPRQTESQATRHHDSGDDVSNVPVGRSDVQEPATPQSPAPQPESAQSAAPQSNTNSGTQTRTDQATSTTSNTGVSPQPSNAAANNADANKQRLEMALAAGDYQQVQLLANNGYAPAYGPLAKYYLRQNRYDEANIYANKSKANGFSDGREVIKALERLGYYDDEE